MVNGKRGWIRIVEATLAIMIVFGAILVITGDKRSVENTDLSVNAKDILEEISKNNTLRDSVLTYDLTSPSNSGSNQEKINQLSLFVGSRLKIANIQHFIKICDANDVCPIDNYPTNSVELYVAERIISTNIDTQQYSPKKVKLFIWR